MPRGVVQEVEAIEEKPVEGAVMGMNALGYLFILTALASGIAWIVYVAKARNNDAYTEAGYDDSVGDTGIPTSEVAANLATAETCFQAAVVSVLFYFVARHHFSHMHY